MDVLCDFLGRHILGSIIGAIGLVMMILGYLEQGKKIATKFEAWKLQATGAALFLVFVIMVLVSFDSKQADAGSLEKSRNPASLIKDKETFAVNDSPKRDSEVAIVEKKHDSKENYAPKELSGPNVDLDGLISAIAGKTSIQRKRAAEPYIGKPIQITGELSDVLSASDYIEIMIYQPNPGFSIFVEISKNNDLAESFSKGMRITVTGVISSVEENHIRIKDGKIIALR